ncbi:MAG: SDR family NAD(P)-dependent oxidoreductase, partial [Shewanella sp.]
MDSRYWAFISGSSQRIGASMARHLHDLGYNIALHYFSSATAATALAQELNQQRANSVKLYCANLSDINSINLLIAELQQDKLAFKVLINNASQFYPTAWDTFDAEKAQQLLQVNMLTPCMLASALHSALAQHQGCIVNLIDIHGERPLKGHGLYSMTKAGLHMATLSMAQELAPEIRVNGIAPGAILWPEHSLTEAQQQVLAEIPMGRTGAL